MKSTLLKLMAPLFLKEPYAGASGFLLSVSGGVDSMVMLDVFSQLKHVHRTFCQVVYFNHHSGRFSVLSDNLVRRAAEEREMEYISVDVPHVAGNFEYESSLFRRNWLLAHLNKHEYVCLGHHRGDLFETVMLSLLRGGGTPGVPGIKSVSGNILRPFLEIDRILIMEHARAMGVPHLLDPTNLSKNQFRGSLRRFWLTQALRSHGGGETGVLNWVKTAQRQNEQLMSRSLSVFESCFSDGILERASFSLDQPYLWPFLIDLFTRRVLKRTLNFRSRERLLQWIEHDECHSLNVGENLLWLDIDGLCLFPLPPQGSVEITVGKPVSWGPWTICFSIESLSEMSGQVSLIPTQSMPREVKDVLRRKRVPYRFRQCIPAVRDGERTMSLMVLFRNKKEIQWEFSGKQRDRQSWNSFFSS
jgi:tRNA(Ile)-lysidine synthetase-like protein